jgi:transcriptional regulator with XRE-family HTH domain
MEQTHNLPKLKKISPFTKELLSKIMTLRQEAGISQEQMALRLGIDQSCYSRLENGTRKLDIDMLQQIANTLQRHLREIV